MIVTRDLYGLKSTGASFRSFLDLTLDDMSFVPSYTDPDVWMRPAVKPDSEHYYKYILVYIDNILALSYNAKM